MKKCYVHPINSAGIELQNMSENIATLNFVYDIDSWDLFHKFFFVIYKQIYSQIWPQLQIRNLRIHEVVWYRPLVLT